MAACKVVVRSASLCTIGCNVGKSFAVNLIQGAGPRDQNDCPMVTILDDLPKYKTLDAILYIL